jgi:phage terminase large subunit-like protein
MTPDLQALHSKKRAYQQEIIEACEGNLYAFATTINPAYLYGDIHREIFSWLADPEANERQLLLLPRGHLKSHCIAVYCAWKITYEPWTTIVYLASQDDLAKAQLFAIKQMMTSDIYTSLWPEMFTEQRGVKGERGTWSAFAFDVDHPSRRERSVRDHTMLIKTVKSNAQGLHCDGLVFDDVVVPQFADSAAGRGELSRSLGYYSSILNAGGWIKAVGTRYHPEDAYQSMIDATIPQWNEELEDFEGEVPAWDVMERVVEDSPQRAGTGKFLWPRTECPNTGKRFGFDIRELAKIKADYVSHQGLIHFFSQYYNDPNDVGTQRIARSSFQYYDEKFLTVRTDKVYFKGNKLNVYAAMDVAWSESERADYTAIAVIGIDSDGYIYILDLDRFRTSDFLTYYERIEALHQRWFFRQLIVETNAAGSLVAQEVENHVRRNGITLTVVRRAKNSRTGSKVENWAAVLEPRYHSKSVLHFSGGLVPTLEEELMSAKPRHDDLKDALCAAVSIAKPPSAGRSVDYDQLNERSNVVVGRFGGRVRIR